MIAFERSELISFEAFMRRALFDPGRGYYTRRIREVGLRGDFTTAPMLSQAPARAIAAWAAKALEETRCRDLIEIGPGEGQLAGAVMARLPLRVRMRTRLHLVETSHPLAERQRVLLGARARWHATPAEALAACGGNAVIYSNELVDAFPVRRFQLGADGRWRELFVELADGKFIAEHFRETNLPESSAFGQKFPCGQIIEVHDSYFHWLAEWMPDWQRGRMLTIDYGAPVESLYHRQPRGSARGYLHQQVRAGTDVYQNIGRQDLTADVNFTDLENASAAWTRPGSLMNFADFLKPHITSGDPADEAMCDIPGPGDAFMVLDQKRRF